MGRTPGLRCQIPHRIAAASLLLALLRAPTAHAEEPVRYVGAFLGVGVTGGVEIFQDRRWAQPVGWTFGVHGRVATVLSLIDVQLEYDHGRLSLAVDGQPSDSPELQLRRHSFATSVNLHPLFLKILANDWWAFTLSAAYLQLGASAEFSSYHSTDGSSQRAETSLGLHWGAGIDFPLGDVEGAHALWLGVMWRWKFLFMEPNLGTSGPNELNSHLLVLSLGYRYNNVNFARLGRPDELRFR